MKAFLAHCARAGVLLLLPLALGACLQRVPSSPVVGSPVAATVPPAFFEATPAACCRTAVAGAERVIPGRYTLREVATVPTDDPRAAWAAPAVGRGAKIVLATVSAAGLRQPITPDLAYELVTDEGVFAALAGGEWDAPAPAGGSPATYRQDGALLFVVPRAVRAGRLDIVEYYYPFVAASGAGVLAPTPVPLARRLIASFAIDRIP